MIQTHLELICEVHAKFAVVNNGNLNKKRILGVGGKTRQSKAIHMRFKFIFDKYNIGSKQLFDFFFLLVATYHVLNKSGRLASVFEVFALVLSNSICNSTLPGQK